MAVAAACFAAKLAGEPSSGNEWIAPPDRLRAPDVVTQPFLGVDRAKADRGFSRVANDTPSFGYRLAVDFGDADLRRQTAEVSGAPTIPQRVPDASVYRRLSRTRGSAAPSSTISATAPFDGCPARLRRALSLRHVPGGRPCIRVVHRRTCGDERTVGNGGHGARDGPARTGIDPRVELRDRQLPGSASYPRSGECGLWMANMRSPWSLRAVLRIGRKDPVCGPARAASDRAWPSLTTASCRPDLRGRRLVRCRTPSDWRNFAGRFRTCPALVTAGLGSSARAVHLSWSTFAAWVWRGRSTVELVVTQW